MDCLRIPYNISLQRGDFELLKRVMKIILLIALAATTLLSNSCNTFIGLGRDLRIAGEGMEKTADKASGGSGGGGDASGAPVY
jgi:predicted small secreted protein